MQFLMLFIQHFFLRKLSQYLKARCYKWPGLTTQQPNESPEIMLKLTHKEECNFWILSFWPHRAWCKLCFHKWENRVQAKVWPYQSVGTSCWKKWSSKVPCAFLGHCLHKKSCPYGTSDCNSPMCTVSKQISLAASWVFSKQAVYLQTLMRLA